MARAERTNGPEGGRAPLHDAKMSAALRAVVITAFVEALAGFAFAGWRAGVGVAAGGALAAANLWVFARLGAAFLSQRGNSAPWAAVAVIKLVALFGGVLLLLRTQVVGALALAVGYGALPVGITMGSLFGAPPDDDSPSP